MTCVNWCAFGLVYCKFIVQVTICIFEGKLPSYLHKQSIGMWFYKEDDSFSFFLCFFFFLDQNQVINSWLHPKQISLRLSEQISQVTAKQNQVSIQLNPAKADAEAAWGWTNLVHIMFSGFVWLGLLTVSFSTPIWTNLKQVRGQCHLREPLSCLWPKKWRINYLVKYQIKSGSSHTAVLDVNNSGMFCSLMTRTIRRISFIISLFWAKRREKLKFFQANRFFLAVWYLWLFTANVIGIKIKHV